MWLNCLWSEQLVTQTLKYEIFQFIHTVAYQMKNYYVYPKQYNYKNVNETKFTKRGCGKRSGKHKERTK